ncbi:MAG: IS21 family transposase [Nitrospirota bacterium]
MRKIDEVCRLRLKMGLGINQIAGACNISTSTASTYVKKIEELNLSYEELTFLDEEALYKLLFPLVAETPVSEKAVLDFEYLTKELKKKGVTLQLLHEEYLRDNPEGYKRSQFYEKYRQYAKKLNPVMRFNHKAGEKMFEDFSGDRPHYINPETGEAVETELFVTALGASSYTFACAVADQKVENFIKGNIKALQYYGGCPECIVPDNLKSGVKSACYYDPEINRTFADMAEHYNVAVVPARVRKPRDKAKVENAVLQAQRRILAALRNRTFFSLNELNEAILEEVDKLNRRPMAVTGKSRRELFEEIEKPVLRPLPAERFEIYNYKTPSKLHIDYHVSVEKSYYSVPYTLIGKVVEVKYNSRVVEVYHKKRRIASHIRTYKKGKYITEDSHMPHEHRQYLEWTPERIKNWGGKTGPYTRTMMHRIMESRKYPEHGFRNCLGIIRLSKQYTPERVESACKRALAVEAYNYRSVKSILQTGLDKVAYLDEHKETKPIEHPNIRGREYYREVMGND